MSLNGYSSSSYGDAVINWWGYDCILNYKWELPLIDWVNLTTDVVVAPRPICMALDQCYSNLVEVLQYQSNWAGWHVKVRILHIFERKQDYGVSSFVFECNFSEIVSGIGIFEG